MTVIGERFTATSTEERSLKMRNGDTAMYTVFVRDERPLVPLVLVDEELFVSLVRELDALRAARGEAGDIPTDIPKTAHGNDGRS